MSMHPQCPSCRNVEVAAIDPEQGRSREPTTMACRKCGTVWVHGFLPLTTSQHVTSRELRSLRYRVRALKPQDVEEAREVGRDYRELHERVHGPVEAKGRDRAGG